MADDKTEIPTDVAKLWKEIQTNTNAELKDLASTPSKFTRKTGMNEPDLDIGPTPYDPSENSKKKVETGS